MKKTFKTFTLMLLTALAFSSCVDVPAPYNLPSKKGGSSAETTVEPAGEGTAASPYNVAAIVAKIKEMEAGVESTEEYYIKGKVSNVKTDASTISQYGNHTFEMIDEGGDNSTVFTAFQVYGPGKQKFTSVDDIKVGDIVVVCGKVVNYRGNTPETVGKGAAYVVSINASGEGGGGSEDEGTVITCAEAVQLTQALADGGTSDETYSIVGYITDTDGKVSRNQQIFWMADTKDGGKIFEAYWADLPEGVSAFTVGMKVKITGKLIKYVSNTGNVTCEMKNPKVVILTDDGGGSGSTTEEGTPVTCAQAVQLTEALADGGTSTETYTITGYITEVVGSVSRNQQTFWMADTKDGGKVFEAYWANLPEGVTEFKVGMKVKITGNLLKYVNNNSGQMTPEIKNATVVVLEEGDGGGGGGDTPPVESTEVSCAEAVTLTNALADGGTSTDTYSVTGYITEVIGNVSRNQQSFWMADTKDGGKVFEAYWANLPSGVSAFTVGMKVKITGQLMKYVKDGAVTPEIKNADVVILEEGDGGGGGDTPPTPGGDTVTELVNGEFESWESDTEATGWKPSGSTSGPGSAVYSQSRDSHEGAYACLVTADEGNNKRLATQEITLEAGTYVFSYYAKSATAPSAQTRVGYVVMSENIENLVYKYNSTFFDINNNGWTLVENEFTLSAQTTVCLIVMNPKSNASKQYTAQDILVDDATLVKK